MLNENFKDMLSAFAEAQAEYLLVGAYAMAAHGCPRATADIGRPRWVSTATTRALQYDVPQVLLNPFSHRKLP